MLKKNNFFFKRLISFKKNNALILESGKNITYNKLIIDSKIISKSLKKEKKLIFLLGKNNLETIAGYISFVNKGYSIALLDFKINDFFLKNLITKYKPSYIFC